MVIGEPNEWNRGEIYTKGSLILDPKFLSYSIPETKRLTWKELALRLDIHTSDIVEDGHNCNLCPFSDDCKAFFKYKNSDEQPQCSFWQQKVDKKVYEANLDRNKIMADLFQCRDIHVFFSLYGECAMRTEEHNRFQYIENVQKIEGK